MTGHIKLGKFTDVTLRDYVLVDPTNEQAATANPYAARVSAGGKYSALDTFNDWTIKDWSSGVDHVDPEEGQKFSLADTRYPGFVLHPTKFRKLYLGNHGVESAGFYTSYYDATNTFTGDVAIYSTRYASVRFTPSASGTATGAWVFISCPYGFTVTAKLCSDNAGVPGTTLKTATITGNYYDPFARWMKAEFTAQALTAGTYYHLVLSSAYTAPSSSGLYPYYPAADPSSGSGNNSHYSTNAGSSWSVSDLGFAYMMTYSTSFDTKGIFPATSAVDGTYYAWYNNTLAKVAIGTITDKLTPTSILDCKNDGNYIYVAADTDYYRYDKSTDTYTTYTGVSSKLFLVYGGYLWRVSSTGVHYTADEVYWTPVGGVDETITGIAGLNDSVYFSTRTGLYCIAPGDVIVQVAAWPEQYATNGVGMVSWEGALYIPIGKGMLVRYDSSGAIINIGLRNKVFTSFESTEFSYLYPGAFFLYAHLKSSSYSTIWAYNGNGWHCLGVAPYGEGGTGCIFVDTTKATPVIMWGLGKQIILSATHYLNPVIDQSRGSTTLIAPEAWVEYDKFFGGYQTLDKDFDRIFIDKKATWTQVHVYWQDETHNGAYGEDGWQYLGKVGGAANSTNEISFPAAQRPTGKWIKLGFRSVIQCNGIDVFPVIQGISLKYSTNVADRWRWVLPILVSNNQQMPDGSVNTYTLAQQKAHIEELIAETAPLQFQDMDGTTYNVKVTGASRNCLRYDWLEGSNVASVQWVYTLTVEEVS